MARSARSKPASGPISSRSTPTRWPTSRTSRRSTRSGSPATASSGSYAAGVSAGGSGTGAASVAWNPISRCDLSQNGLFFDAPHRHSANGRPTGVGYGLPFQSTSFTSSPSTLYEPFCLTVMVVGIVSTHLLHRGEELGVRARLRQLVDQQFHCFDGRQRVEHLAQHPDAVEIVFRDEQLFLPRAALEDFDGREHALVGELPVEMDFHVAGALELLEDHVVHARAGVDERGRHDRQRPTFFDVARRAEEALRLLQRVAVQTA